MKQLKNILIILFLSLSIFTSARDCEEILQSGKIYIGFDPSDIGTINYTLAYEFATFMNLEVVEVIVDWDQLFQNNGVRPKDLESNPQISFTPDAFRKIDIYCSSISPLHWRKKLFDFAETLLSAEILLIRKDLSHAPKDIYQMKGLQIALMDGTSFVTHLNSINDKIGGGIEMMKTIDGETAKQLLLDGKVDGVILDADDALNFNKSHQMLFDLAFPINKVSKTVWAVEKGNELQDHVKNYFKTIENNGFLDQLFESKYASKYSDFADQLVPHTPVQLYQRDLPEILASKKIVVSLRERDFVFHQKGQKQFMHILAEEFAEYLGVKMEYVVVNDYNMYWQDTEGIIHKDSSYTPDIFNYFDLAVDIFANLEWRSRKIDFRPIYTSEYAILAKPATKIKSFHDLHKLIGITSKNTMYHDVLQQKGIHKLKYTSTNQLVNAVREDQADYTLIFNAFLYPDLESKISLGTLDINWGTRKNQPLLQQAIDQFIEESSQNGLLSTLSKISKGSSLNNLDDFMNSYYESSQPGTLPHILVGVEEGLPQEDVRSIFQDSKGYLWFGTLSGIVRYDGRKMDQWNTTNGLINNAVYDITEGPDNNLYVATERGLSVINSKDEITNYPSTYTLHRIFIDCDHQIWLLSDQSIFVLKDGQIQNASSLFQLEFPKRVNTMDQDTALNYYFLSTPEGLFSFNKEKKIIEKWIEGPIYSVFIDRKNQIWYSSSKGIFYDDITSFLSKKIKPALNDDIQIPVSPINGISQSISGSIWLKNSTHLYQVISPQQKAIQYSSGNDLLNNFILSYAEDNEENLWIGYSGGLQRIINNKNIRNLKPDELNSYIYSTIEDPMGNIWVSTNKWVYKYNVDTDQLENISQKWGLKLGPSIIRNLSNNHLIIINEEGIFEIDPQYNQLVYQNKTSLKGLSDAFFTSKKELFIIANRMGMVYYFPDYKADYIALKSSLTSNILGLVEWNKEVLGINNNQLIVFNGNNFIKKQEFQNDLTSIGVVDQKIWLGSIGSLMSLDGDEIHKIQLDEHLAIKSLIPSRNRNHLWMGTNLGVYYFNLEKLETIFKISAKDGLSGNEVIQNGLYLDKKGILWISTYHGLSNFNIKGTLDAQTSPKCYLEAVSVNENPILIKENNLFEHSENNLSFELSGLSFSDEKSVIYEHYLRHDINGLQNFKRQSNEHWVYYNNLPPGSYQFVYRAKGKDDIWSYTNSYSFSISKAYWQEWWFIGGASVLVLLLLFIIYKLNVRRIEAQKKQLELLVKERTIDLENANIKVVQQMKIAEEQKEQITNSIHYAERIQKSLLPNELSFQSHISDFFVLFKPRDIVSGDFYWMTELDQNLLVAAVDCTGHGVPGAFMSMLGISFLKEIVEREKSPDPAFIMNEMRTAVISALQQDKSHNISKDGMDMSLVSIDLESLELRFAGANNPVYIIRKDQENPLVYEAGRIKTKDGSFIEIRGDKMPIAIYDRMDDFENVSIQLNKGDRVYLFSDGYMDQFGGAKAKKLKSAAFKKLLIELQDQPMHECQLMLEAFFEQWRGQEEQVDDVTLIGLEI